MSDKNKFLRGGLVLSLGNALSQVFSLLRNLIVARLVSPEEFGVAVTFALTLSVLEAAVAHGFDKLLIQDEEGEEVTLQSMLHAILVSRGLLIAAAIFLAAPWIAMAFDVPEATPAYRMLAVVPLLRGFMHLDVKRMQRHMAFGPDIASRLVSQGLGLIVAIVYAALFQDYWAMLWGVLVQAFALTVLSHLLAERGYRIDWDSGYSQKVVNFSLPIMINGIIMILSDQGNRILVGARLSVGNLALFSAAAMPLEAGLTFLSQVAGDLSVPWLSSVKSDPERFRYRHHLTGMAIACASVVFFAPFALLGMDLTVLIFGERYAGPEAMMAWLALGFGLRFLRVWPIVTSICFGDTQNLMLSNLARASGIGFAVVLIEAGWGLTGAAAALALSEGMATCVAFYRLRRFSDKALAPGWPLLFGTLAGFAIAITASVILDGLLLRILFSMGFVATGMGLLFLIEPRLLLMLRRGQPG